jgi:hypothetical protein
VIRVKAAFFSITPQAPPGDEDGYLRWHLLDHMPEQYQLPGIQLAMRYIADGALPDARIAGEGPLAELGNVVNYLVGDPVQETHDDFMALGRRLSDMGRFPVRRPSIQVRMPALLRWYASPRVQVSPEVVPYRPHRGIVLVVEEPTGEQPWEWLQWLHAEHHRALLDVSGVAGVWMYGETASWKLHRNCQGDPQYTTVVYCDEDPLAVAAALRQPLAERWASGAVRPLFAGPLRTMIDWEAWT